MGQPRLGQTLSLDQGLTLQVEPVSGETYRPAESAGPYLFGLFKVDPNGTATMIYENWANEQRLDGPTWTLAPGSAGLNALAQQLLGDATLQLWVRAYMGTETSQHWSEASIINVQVHNVPFFVIGNPPPADIIDPLNITIGDYLTYLEMFYDGLSDAVSSVDCGTPSADPTEVAMGCVSLIWATAPEPVRTALDVAADIAGCAVGTAVRPDAALRECAGLATVGAKLIVYVTHQALLSTDAGRALLDQKLLPGG